MSTNRVETVKTLIAALQSGDMELAARILDDTFTMTGFLPKALNKEQFLSLQDALLLAMPDLSYELAEVVRSDKGEDTVTAHTTLTGTHTDTLSLPLPGLESIPATGIHVTLPQTTITCQAAQGRVKQLDFENVTGGGFSGLLQQLGSELPLLQNEWTEPDTGEDDTTVQ
ncbi:hypothetical protein KDW_24590 [Dictyobacter vulcani]|uniref:SnoaL-like domain-containing protein n=1 Tax=Dictyobacter vulcani TaxID=2607529 RepID=A0A5J4KPC5_9CHLR|nr:nuclear transport factor 2 family protein [Dictyobacter vulcani]GER88297.1 hypothetical protein KDW_24590 [Dictyobacter vulcani]